MNELEVIIERFESGEKQTLGFLFVLISNKLELKLCTLELGWHDNSRKTSCIPKGKYQVSKRYSTKYKDHFHILNVPGRDYILIHSGNKYTHTLGCILPGLEQKDIDNDGLLDVTNSRDAMKKLNELLPDEFVIEIR